MRTRKCATGVSPIVALGIPILQSFGFCDADVPVAQNSAFFTIAEVQLRIAAPENQVHIGFTSWVDWVILGDSVDGIVFRATVDNVVQDDAETRLNSTETGTYSSTVGMIHRFSGFLPGMHTLRIEARAGIGAAAVLRTVQLAGQVLASGDPQAGS